MIYTLPGPIEDSLLIKDPAYLPSVAPRGGDDEDDFDLRYYGAILWRSRILIALCAIVCGGIGLALSLTASRKYESEATLVVARPKLAEGSDATAVANFIPLISNRSVAAQVIKEFQLDQPPYEASPTNFFGHYVSVQEVRASTVLVVKGTLEDPQLVTRVINRIADLAVENARLVSQQEALVARDDIKAQLTESRKRMDDAEATLNAFKHKSQIEVLRKDVHAALEERGGLLALQIGIEKERARLKQAEGELAARERIDTVKRTIDSEPAMMEAARKSAGSAPISGIELRAELMNPVYQKLDEQIASSRVALASLERQRAQLASRKLDAPAVALLTALYDKESELTRLEMERDLTRRVYLQVANSYETARLTVAGRSSALQIIGRAIAPDRPVSRNAARNTAIALGAGLLLGILLTLVYSMMAPLPVTTRPAR
jgi:uncharacterized protein involved in exopolysaccharide biosynthesis